jgi:hypothetical protein
MEKAPVDIDASNATNEESTDKPNQQDEDSKPDYSSKATTKTTFRDYLRIFTYSTLGDRIFLVSGIFMDRYHSRSILYSCVSPCHKSLDLRTRITLFQLLNPFPRQG